MSIVEKALQKLQSAGQAKPATPAPKVSVSAEAAPASPAASAVTDVRRRPRVTLNPAKTVRVDFDKLRFEGLMPPEHQQRELAHQYRTLKRPLIRNAFEESGDTRVGTRSIMVSSALPGEGKTFTSINLAMSLAMERDHSVLLLDGDIPKPHVSTALGVRDEPGLLDLLSDSSLPVESVVLPTDVRGLSVLPVGRNRADSATELLASARMRDIISQLERLDPQGLVLVDSPPILLTSEARVLAQLFGQVVVVVKAGATPQQAVTEAISIIGEGPRLGLVLNEAVQETSHAQYGYYYGSDSLPSAAALRGEPAADPNDKT
jgi:protein-tyrosine kinase